jgi:hypothetical protein
MLALAPAAAPPSQRPPNFVFIQGEAQGPSSISVDMDGDPATPARPSGLTPNLEKLAADGMRFSDFYASCPRCTPSRASFVTGISPAKLHMTYQNEGGASRREGGAKGGGKRKPAQDGIVKPGMEDTIRASMYADNWFMLYVNGKPVAVDSIDFLPHNVVAVDLLPEYPMTIAVLAKDNADPKTGCEYGRQIGDGGFILKFGDGTVTDASWKARCFFHGPVNRDTANPTVRTEPLPADWFAPGFDDASWANATEYSQERIDPKQPFFEHDFKGAKWIWTSDLDLDNTVVLRKRVERPGVKPRWTTKPDLDVSNAPRS